MRDLQHQPWRDDLLQKFPQERMIEDCEGLEGYLGSGERVKLMRLLFYQVFKLWLTPHSFTV